VKTLNDLVAARADLFTRYEKLPITMKSKLAINKKNEIEKNLEIIENSIRQFSKKIVFIKVN